MRRPGRAAEARNHPRGRRDGCHATGAPHAAQELIEPGGARPPASAVVFEALMDRQQIGWHGFQFHIVMRSEALFVMRASQFARACADVCRGTGASGGAGWRIARDAHLAAQLPKRAPQPGAHRGRRDAQNRADLGRVHARVVAQDDDQPQIFIQRADSPT